jgi:hypothetical protein
MDRFVKLESSQLSASVETSVPALIVFQTVLRLVVCK